MFCRDTDSNQSTPRSMSFSTASSPPRGTPQPLLDPRPSSADSRRLPRGAAGRRSETGLGNHLSLRLGRFKKGRPCNAMFPACYQ